LYNGEREWWTTVIGGIKRQSREVDSFNSLKKKLRTKCPYTKVWLVSLFCHVRRTEENEKQENNKKGEEKNLDFPRFQYAPEHRTD